MTAESLLADARGLIATPDRRLGANRCVAAAFLIRGALEEALDRFWVGRAPGMERVNMRGQLTALPFFLEPSLAGDIRASWHQLSDACHPDAYELPPTPGELMLLAAAVDQLATAARA